LHVLIPTVIVGLGRVGTLAVQQVKELYLELPEKDRVPASFLTIEIEDPFLTEGRSRGLWESDERLRIDGSTVRSVLRNLDRSWNGIPAWSKVLAWFPHDRAAVTLDELSANGARSSRLVGRLGFFSYDHLIENALTGAFWRASGARRPASPIRVLLVAALWEGGGSGMLLDVAYAVLRQEETARVAAYLLFPTPSLDLPQAQHLRANSYAGLRELYHLGYQLVPFEAEYYRIPGIKAQGGREGFRQIFLFEPCHGAEGDSLARSCSPMAQAIAAQLQRGFQETAGHLVAELGLPTRGHVFSTSGCCIIPLSRAEPSDGLVREVGRLLRDWEIAAEANGSSWSESSMEAHRSDATSGSGARESGEAEESRDLVERWSEKVERFISTRLGAVIEDIRQNVERLCTREGGLTTSMAREVDELRVLLDPQPDLDPLPESGPWRAMLKIHELRDGLRIENRSFLSEVTPALRFAGGPRLAQFLDQCRSFDPKVGTRSEAVPAGLHDLVEKWDLIDRAQKSFESRPRLWRLVPSSVVRKRMAGLKCAAILEAIGAPSFHQHLKAAVLVMAHASLLEEIKRKFGDPAQRAPREMLISDEPAPGAAAVELPPQLRQVLQEVVLEKGREIRDALAKIDSVEGPGQVEGGQESFIRKVVIGEWMFQGAQYLVGWECEPEVKIQQAIESCRSHLFEHFAPHPYAFAVVLLPPKVFWVAGEEDLEAFLRREVQAVLSCPCFVLDDEGDCIRIYYEDLFHPPESLRPLESYYEAYRQEPDPEALHIDYRLLADPRFKEIAGAGRDRVVTCGNPGCSADLSGQPRTLRICPACHRLIRSRCGNKGCTLEFLHIHPHGRGKTCPGCAGFNHAAWWRCWRHGKIEVAIPVEKVRCPRCIQEHLDDRAFFPTERISRRPDLQMAAICPNCERLEESDPSHRPFVVAPDLLPFYKDGVYGHDQERFFELARKYELAEGHLCPVCRTFLIPVDHRAWGQRAAPEAEPLGT
jgi:Tubulin like